MNRQEGENFVRARMRAREGSETRDCLLGGLVDLLLGLVGYVACLVLGRLGGVLDRRLAAGDDVAGLVDGAGSETASLVNVAGCLVALLLRLDVLVGRVEDVSAELATLLNEVRESLLCLLGVGLAL